MPKSDYVKAYEILSQLLTPNHRYNRYVSLQLEMKDTKLAGLISDLICCINQVKKRIPDSRTGYSKSLITLKTYIEAKMKSDKPSWQIEAERNGWRNTKNIEADIRCTIDTHEDHQVLVDAGGFDKLKDKEDYYMVQDKNLMCPYCEELLYHYGRGLDGIYRYICMNKDCVCNGDVKCLFTKEEKEGEK